jgi:hypothetical protein
MKTALRALRQRLGLGLRLGLLCVLASCTDSVPALFDARLLPVFDFASDTARSVLYVHVLAQPASSLDLADSLKLTHSETGFAWNIDAPITLQGSGGVWLASPRLAPQDRTQGFAPGAYRIAYMDTAGRVAERSLDLAFPAALKTASAKTAASALPGETAAKIAIYDQDGNLLYFGDRAQTLSADGQILQRYSAAFSYRECLIPQDNSLAVLLPLVYLKAPDNASF